MLQDVSVFFFQKTPRKPQKIRYIYLRVLVDGIARENSTKRKWPADRWDQKLGRAIGTKEDARILNTYLQSKEIEVFKARETLLREEMPISAQDIIDIINGRSGNKTKVLEEFQVHNDQMKALVRTKENPNLDFAPGTYERYVTAKSHVAEFIKFKYDRDDLEFAHIDYQFAKDYEFYLKTVRKCAHNTALKYIANFKKIVLIAKDKKIIRDDPFARYKRKKLKNKKNPLTWEALRVIEEYPFSIERLSEVRDIFIFQCYTGLAYADVRNLKKKDIIKDRAGKLYIDSMRVKTKSDFDVPLLPTPIRLLKKYEIHPFCQSTGRAMPVISNQKMNAYLKEIATICALKMSDLFIPDLHTHMARRTFAITVALNNGVSIVAVKEMLGHATVKQTEEYAITEKDFVHAEMQTLELTIEKRKNISLDKGELQDRNMSLEELMQEMERLKAQIEERLANPI
ncbi:site-specific integrase [Pedobacter agri]|uniref:Site-specific integrase n=1 Tax=Pedobacter agri TaxID=454586 RepID=A0A9X3DDJ8_9SPHI|nr:site-specific integrase [Pedobacter agri]MCX3265667.1 site-specific integrase [Pedobacter agri]